MIEVVIYKIMVLLVLTFTAVMLGCGARLTLTPENVAVLQGTEVTMKCGSDSANTLMWRILWNSSVGTKTIYTGSKIASEFSSFYRISTIKSGEINLVVRANSATAKTYFCEEHGSDEAKASAELIVLASDPTCGEENRVNDIGATEPRLQLSCRLLYWGNWAPIMEWKRVRIGGSNYQNSSRIEGVLNRSDNYSVMSTLTVRGSQHNGTRYVCNTHFTGSQRSWSMGANNIPVYSYTYTWEYHAQNETGGNEAVAAVVTCLVTLMVIASAIAAFIIFIKRKQPNNTIDQHDSLEIDEMEELRKTHSEESEYVEIGRSSIIGCHRNCEARYVGRNELELSKANFDASLEEKLGVDSSKSDISGLYASATVYSFATDRKPVVKDIGESGTNNYMEVIL